MKCLQFGIGAAILLAAGCQSEMQDSPTPAAATENTDTPEAVSFQVPVEYHKLENGLKVVLSQDKTSACRYVGRLLQHRLPHRAP